MISTRAHYREKGVTSLVVVMFSTLLFVIVSVGFMQQMIAEQRSAIDNELSRGAYDSALAGVEDGKRVLQRCAQDPTSDACTAIQANQCNTVRRAGIIGDSTTSTDEVRIKSEVRGTGTDGSEYDQAYTCVKINRNRNDYLGVLSDGASNVIPIRTVVNNFDAIKIEWFTQGDAGGTTTINNYPTLGQPLLDRGSWPRNRPSIMRVQVIMYQGAVDPQYFDEADHMSTVYLYPKTAGVSTPISVVVKRSEPVGVECSGDISMAMYACSATLSIPPGYTTYLRVTPIYGETNFAITPYRGGVPVQFDNVQPAIDSTGRAGDVFRRVESRVERSSENTPYPRATVDITGNLCKTMRVTNDPNDYDVGSCTP